MARLPERFGPWKSVFNPFSAWAKRGVWERIFKALQVAVDKTASIVDATVVRAHQAAAGGKGLQCNALGRSRGGFSTKIHAIVDTQGKPLRIPPGRQHEATVAEELLLHARRPALIADAGYDSDQFIAAVQTRKMLPVICAHPCRKKRRRLDRSLYRLRYFDEVLFHDLKIRDIATRFEKTSRNFLPLVHVAHCGLRNIRDTP